MQWVLVALIIGSLVYIGHIIMEYTHYVIQVKPMIKRLVERALELDDLVERERNEIVEVRARMDRLRPSIGNISDALDQVRRLRNAELTRRQRLDMVVLKNRLRGANRMSVT